MRVVIMPTPKDMAITLLSFILTAISALDKSALNKMKYNVNTALYYLYFSGCSLAGDNTSKGLIQNFTVSYSLAPIPLIKVSTNPTTLSTTRS